MKTESILSRLAARLLILLPLLVLSTATPPPVHAQELERGTLQGRILDAETEEPLPFANVVFLRVTREEPGGIAAGGAMGTAEGTFSAKVEPGNYNVMFTYISYEKVTVTGVYVPPGETVNIDGFLPRAAIEIKPVEVTAKAIRNAEGSMLAKLRTQATVKDAITSEQISKSGDSNAAQALQRVTGVSVVGGKYVFVRGLGERYSSTQVNGSAVGTPETNKRVVPLDLFPSGVLDNIEVQKTYTPDMDADFGGGVVNINTRDFVEGHSFRQSLSLGYDQSGNADAFLTYSGGKRDWLGFDDGTRALPDLVSSTDKRIDRFNFTTEERQAMTRAFSNVWTPRAESQSPGFSYAAVYNRQFRLFGKDGGMLASGSLSNSYTATEREENEYVSGSPWTLYDVNQSERNVLGGLTGNFSLRLKEEEDPDRIKLNLLYTRGADDIVKVSEGLNNDWGVDYARVTDIAYIERGLFHSVLQGVHQTGILGLKFDWNLGYSEASRNEPDRRRYSYQKDPAGEAVEVGGRTPHPFQRMFGESGEYTRSTKLDWTLPLGTLSEREALFKFGYVNRNKDRAEAMRRFGFTCQRGGNCNVDRSLIPELIVAPDTLDAPNYIIEELTLASDRYSANQDISAGYFMIDTPLATWLRLVAGYRYEDSEQNVTVRNPYAIAGQNEPQTFRNDDAGWLPSVNLTLTPNRKTNFRVAYARTLNRPELREISPFRYYNFEKGWEEVGNEDVKTARIENYDARVEYYAGPGEFLAFALFQKDFTDPIQKVIDPGATGFAEKPFNGNDARLQGFETEVRVSFVSVWRALDWLVDLEAEEIPESMLRWSILANYSRIDSETNIDLGPPVGVKSTPFTGQSDYSLNLGLFYRHLRWEGSLLYKSFGERLALFGLSSRHVDLREKPASDLDFALSYRFSNVSQLKFSARNILDQATVYSQPDGKIFRKWEDGRSFGISFAYTPQFGDGE